MGNHIGSYHYHNEFIVDKEATGIFRISISYINCVGIDLWLKLIETLIVPELWIGKLISYLIGLILIGLGTAMYLYTNFAPAPIDQLMLIIRELTKINILFSRTLQYLLFMILAIIFEGPIGIGTVITLFLGGPILNYFMPIVEKRLNAFLLKREAKFI